MILSQANFSAFDSTPTRTFLQRNICAIILHLRCELVVCCVANAVQSCLARSDRTGLDHEEAASVQLWGPKESDAFDDFRVLDRLYGSHGRHTRRGL